MESNTIDDRNEAIAIFEGGEFIKGDPNHKCNFCYAGDEPCTPAIDRFIKNGRTVFHYELKYHEDWNKLMPVIEKISGLPLMDTNNIFCTHPQDTCHPITFNMTTEDGKQFMFRFKGFSLHTADKLIDAAYAAVHEVCQWYNQNKNNEQ